MNNLAENRVRRIHTIHEESTLINPVFSMASHIKSAPRMLQTNARMSLPRQHRGGIPSAHYPHLIEAIIFDIGRVIVRLEPRRALAILAQSAGTAAKSALQSDSHSAAGIADAAATADKMWAAVQADPMWHDWQEGRVTAAEWHQNICRRFGLNISFEDFCRAWNNVIAPDLILPERLFRQLAKRVRLVLLSNTDVIHVDHMESAFTFTRHFHAKIYSCEVGASKPGRAIFQAALKAAGTPASRSLFIDDVQAYVLAARRYGLQAIQFRNRPQLEAELRRRKLLER
jgi:glucose-1-phosphatase